MPPVPYDMDAVALDTSRHIPPLTPRRLKFRKHSVSHSFTAQHDQPSTPSPQALQQQQQQQQQPKGFFGRLIARTKSSTSLSAAFHFHPPHPQALPVPPVPPTPLTAPPQANTAALDQQDEPLPRQSTTFSGQSSWRSCSGTSGAAVTTPGTSPYTTATARKPRVSHKPSDSFVSTHGARTGHGTVLDFLRRDTSPASPPLHDGYTARPSSRRVDFTAKPRPSSKGRADHGSTARPSSKSGMSSLTVPPSLSSVSLALYEPLPAAVVSSGEATLHLTPDAAFGTEADETEMMAAGMSFASLASATSQADCSTARMHPPVVQDIGACTAGSATLPRKVRSAAHIGAHSQPPVSAAGRAHRLRRVSHMDLSAHTASGPAGRDAGPPGFAGWPGTSWAARSVTGGTDLEVASPSQWTDSSSVRTGGSNAPLLPPPGWRKRTRSSTAGGASAPEPGEMACGGAGGGLAPRTRHHPRKQRAALAHAPQQPGQLESVPSKGLEARERHSGRGLEPPRPAV